MLTYEDALNFIHNLNRFGTKLGLQNITNLLEILGNPHHGLKIIHVAGTNGKGSTCAMVDSILRAAGYKVGLYTSPYLEVFNERIRVNGENISNDDIARLTLKVKDAMTVMKEKGLGFPTEFEVVTALGLLYFKEQAVDFLVFEVGMGGRLDATNVVTPLVSVITPISLDHQQYLGNTLTDIAREKCGIIKPGVPVVSSVQEDEAMRVIEETCERLGCPLIRVVEPDDYKSEQDCLTYKLIESSINGQIFDIMTKRHLYHKASISLIGYHQLNNATTAVGAIEALKLSGLDIDTKAIYSGLKQAQWPGRLEILSRQPTILIDGAHNIAGIDSLKQALESYFRDKERILVLGILKDKDAREMLKEIVTLADTIITTSPNNPRALTADELANIIREVFDQSANDEKDSVTVNNKRIKIYVRERVAEAVEQALKLASPENMVVFAGSLYMIGEARPIISKAVTK